MAARRPGAVNEYDSVGNLLVNVAAGAGGGTSEIDESPFTAGVTPGTPIMGEDPTSGENLVLQTVPGTRILEVGGSITVSPVESDTCSTNALVAVSTSSVTAIAANASRKRLILQNQGTTILYILLGSGSASLTNYTFALAACGTTKDGSSPVIFDEMWQGAVQVISSAAGGLLNAQENT